MRAGGLERGQNGTRGDGKIAEIGRYRAPFELSWTCHGPALDPLAAAAVEGEPGYPCSAAQTPGGHLSIAIFQTSQNDLNDGSKRASVMLITHPFQPRSGLFRFFSSSVCHATLCRIMHCGNPREPQRERGRRRAWRGLVVGWFAC